MGGSPVTFIWVMGGALLMDMVLGAVAGGSIPLILRALGRDPAQGVKRFSHRPDRWSGFFYLSGTGHADPALNDSAQRSATGSK